MRILFAAEDTSGLLHKLYHYLEQELASRINVTVWRKSGHIDYILKQIPVKPDFILLLNDMDHQMSPIIKGIAQCHIPAGLFVNDVHRFIKLRKNYIIQNKIQHVFPVVRDRFIQTYPEFAHDIHWFPHFVHTDIYQDYHLKKEIPLLMTGAVSNVYPLRHKIIQYYKDDPNFTYLPHPGYKNFDKVEEKKQLIGRPYAKTLNRAKIVFTCPSIYQYPVIKYFEVLSCKTLLLAPTFQELEDLGFIPYRHFVPINETNFMKKATYYLEHEAERQKIAQQGYQFIRQHHSVSQRTKELIRTIERII